MNKPLSFGTDGIRAHADEFPFTTHALNALGKAIAQWAMKKYKDQPQPGILIGHDTRISCPRIKKDLIAGLGSFSLSIVDGGIMPTPAMYQLIKDDERFQLGIIISASHNPYYDNGIKLFDAKSSKLNKDDESIIESYFASWYSHEENTTAQQQTCNLQIWEKAAQTYQEKIATLFPQHFLKGLKIVLDCANGATSSIAPNLFTQLGAEVITIANQPTGTNINEHCGATHPAALQAKVLECSAHIGFAFDGDGDRLIAVSQAGVIKNGDDILFLLLSLPEYTSTPAIVGTVMSNQGFEQALIKLNKKLLRTKVGDKYVAEALAKNKLPLGGEISGHTIIQDYMPTSDGIFVALKVVQAAKLHNNWELTTFAAFPQILLNLPIANKKDLTCPPLSTIIAAYEEKLSTGRILVRYSGTEKILRVMTEAPSQELASLTAQSLAQDLQKALANDSLK